MSFSDRCKYHCALLVYKTLNGMAPNDMSEIVRLSSNDTYSLRSSTHQNLSIKHKPRTNLYRDTFAFYSMRIWNDIPISIRSSSSLNSFKNSYKCHLINVNEG